MFCDFCRRKARANKNRKTVFRGIEDNGEVRSTGGSRRPALSYVEGSPAAAGLIRGTLNG